MYYNVDIILKGMILMREKYFEDLGLDEINILEKFNIDINKIIDNKEEKVDEKKESDK